MRQSFPAVVSSSFVAIDTHCTLSDGKHSNNTNNVPAILDPFLSNNFFVLKFPHFFFRAFFFFHFQIFFLIFLANVGMLLIQSVPDVLPSVKYPKLGNIPVFAFFFLGGKE